MNRSDNKLAVKIAVGSLSSPLEVGADRAPTVAAELAALLSDEGCNVVPLGPVITPELAVQAGKKLAESHVDAVALAATSWYEDYLVLDLWEECSVPIFLWSLPGMETGALCGNQQLTTYLKQLEIPFQCFYGKLDDPAGLQKAKSFFQACALKRKLRRARIGLAGHRVAGMTEVSANEMALKKSLGPRIVPLNVSQLLDQAREVPEEQARSIWKSVCERSGSCKVTDETGLESVRIYLSIRQQVQKFGLSALTVGCYPHLMGKVWLASTLLADEGIPLGCEGDVNGAVGQLILTSLTGQPTHNTDFLEPLADGLIVYTHCGSGSFSLAEDPKRITLDSVRLMGQGVCSLFTAKPGPVTLINLIPRGDGYQCAVMEGEAISTEMVFPGNPLRVRFDSPLDRILEWIHEEGIGHHWMAGYGHVGKILHTWSSLCGPTLKTVKI